MGTPTYDPIQTVTLGANAASITLSSIPAGYTDLVLVLVLAGSNGTPQNICCQVNSDTGANYSSTGLQGDGASATSARASSNTFMYSTTAAIVDGVVGGSSAFLHFMNYSNTTTNKTVLQRGGNVAASTSVVTGVSLWRSTAAINAIKIYLATGNILSGSKVTLFGVKAA